MESNYVCEHVLCVPHVNKRRRVFGIREMPPEKGSKLIPHIFHRCGSEIKSFLLVDCEIWGRICFVCAE